MTISLPLPPNIMKLNMKQGAPFLAFVAHNLFILLLATNLVQKVALQISTVQVHVIKRYTCQIHTCYFAV